MSRALTALAVIASVGLAGSSAANAQTPLRTWLAAGDSFSSGEGLPHSAGRCARALPGSGSAAWSDVARDRIGSALPLLAHPRLVACKGATTSGFFSSDQWQPSLGRFDLVTFTMGGNDIRFSPILNQCIGLPGDGLPTDPGHNCPKESLLRARITSTLETPYREFLTKVATDAVVTGGHIVVLGYPELIEHPDLWPAGTRSCSLIGIADAHELRGLGGHLNATIGWSVRVVDTARPNGVHVTFIDVNSGGGLISRYDQSLFEPASGPRHNLCATQPWINGFTTIDYGSGSFHPKQAGQDGMGALAAQVIPRVMP
jgi:lysophospholipase L1-like esterase